jgi:hypothetical protein
MILYIIQNILKTSQTPYTEDIPERSPPAKRGQSEMKIPHATPHNEYPRTETPHLTPFENKHQHATLRNTITFIGLILLTAITLKHITQGKNAIALGAALACGGHGTADSIHDMIPNQKTKRPSAKTQTPPIPPHHRRNLQFSQNHTPIVSSHTPRPDNHTPQAAHRRRNILLTLPRRKRGRPPPTHKIRKRTMTETHANKSFTSTAPDELYHHIDIPKCMEINKAFNPLSITFQNINGKFGSKSTATSGKQEIQTLNRAITSAGLFNKNAACSALHGIADTRLTKAGSETLAAKLIDKHITLLYAPMPYGTNTADVALMISPQWAAALVSSKGSMDGRTLQATFRSIDGLSLILVMVIYQPPSGAKISNGQTLTNNQIRAQINKRAQKAHTFF